MIDLIEDFSIFHTLLLIFSSIKNISNLDSGLSQSPDRSPHGAATRNLSRDMRLFKKHVRVVYTCSMVVMARLMARIFVIDKHVRWAGTHRSCIAARIFEAGMIVKHVGVRQAWCVSHYLVYPSMNLEVAISEKIDD